MYKISGASHRGFSTGHHLRFGAMILEVLNIFIVEIRNGLCLMILYSPKISYLGMIVTCKLKGKINVGDNLKAGTNQYIRTLHIPV